MDEHVFLEDIIYCPTQIYYYFKDNQEQAWCAYVRQRGGPLTFELVRADLDTGDFIDSWDMWEKIEFSRIYDINNKNDENLEEQEIIELEKEVMSFLRQRFPELKFPEKPKRKTRRII